MSLRRPPPALAAALALAIGASWASAGPAQADGRRNHAEEMPEDDLREERPREREEAGRERLEHREEQQERDLEHPADRSSPGRGSLSPRSSSPSGRPCMYGPNDEVIYRPPGAVCAGDQPSQAAPQENQAPQQQTAPAPGSRPQPSAPANSAPARKPTKGRCIYGADGKLVWSEPGADC